MSDPNLLDILRTLRFLRDVTEELLSQIASMARVEAYPAEVVLFSEGAVLSRVFLIAEGTVSLEVQGSAREGRRFLTVGEGELLGWSPLLGQQAMTATARVQSPARVVSIDAAQLLALCQDNPLFGFVFMSRMVEALALRLNAMRLQLLDLLQDDLPEIPDEPGAGD